MLCCDAAAAAVLCCCDAVAVHRFGKGHTERLIVDFWKTKKKIDKAENVRIKAEDPKNTDPPFRHTPASALQHFLWLLLKDQAKVDQLPSSALLFFSALLFCL